MQVDVNLIISIIGALVGVGGFLLAYVKYIRGQENRISCLETRSQDIGKDMADVKGKLDSILKSEEDKGERIKALETKMELWWTAVQATAIKMLKHPTARRRDELLDKLDSKQITMAEMEKLKDLLRCDVTSKKKDSIYAAMVVARLDMLLYDMKKTAGLSGNNQ
jgi:hypothetical protein